MRARVPASEVDDVLQVAAMRALERHASVQEPTRIRAWLYRLHRNVVVDVLRTRQSRARLDARTQQEPAEDVQWPAPLLDAMCRCSLTQARLVPEPYASMLALVDVGDATVAEASAQLGISPNNGAVRLHRARKALRKRMLEHCGVSSLRECADCRCVDDGCCA